MKAEPVRNFTVVTLGVVGAVFLVASLISLSNSNQWFVRVLDFLREPWGWLALLLGVVAVLVKRPAGYAVGALFVATVLIQLVRIWPYVPLANDQIRLSHKTGAGACFTALALNVKQSNDQYGRVASLIREQEPDLLLLMETDGAWKSALSDELARFAHVSAMPLDNTYGMIFATRLELEQARMVANTSADTPTMYATLGLPNGRRFEFVGLHPRPPRPGQDTDTRDANIARAGQVTPNRLADVLVMGDFNDVPWSSTTSRFRHEGGYRDPRIGRGTFPTFPAGHVWLGWPLDQVLVKNAMEVQSFSVLRDVGADHRPMRARLCLG
ncbi:endonuclease/exonuclease/phosphatase family protein [Erythrobacter sp. LQ02-29]|uniref:endonuclease/exonuclease/phosphatase family protein n=1 Tax=Erythrobacter sp. LQ02-29 TaxID=2920384 RepID=UPI001F4E2256|nr:endonuclease/exonuclease/phosphatase family protein [Erythrobacter sp. LQ02-29]MCP9222109.1 endonuclease/exonuclease/phosphatase family protein [Erythrobacter sp. LQ02-29]